jgi:hypothetical protein
MTNTDGQDFAENMPLLKFSLCIFWKEIFVALGGDLLLPIQQSAMNV